MPWLYSPSRSSSGDTRENIKIIQQIQLLKLYHLYSSKMPFEIGTLCPSKIYYHRGKYGKIGNMAVCQNLVPLVNIKIAGKWMFIPLKMVLIGIDPYPYPY